MQKGDQANARRALDTLEARIPPNLVALEYPYSSILVDIYSRAGNEAKARAYARFTADKIRNMMLADPNWRENDPYARQMRVDYTFADMLLRAGEYDSAKVAFATLKSAAQPAEAALFDLKIEEAEGRKLDEAGNKQAALAKYNDIAAKLQRDGADISRESPSMAERRIALAKELGVPLPAVPRDSTPAKMAQDTPGKKDGTAQQH